MSIADWINAYVPGGLSSNARPAARRRLQHRVRRRDEPCRARSTCSTCSATRGRATCGSSASRTRSTTCAAATTRSRRCSTQALGGQITHRDASSSRSGATQTATYRLTFKQGGSSKQVTADHVVLALPFSIMRSSVDWSQAGFGPVKTRAIQRAGHGNELQAACPVHRPPLERAGQQRQHVRGHRLPEHLGGHALAARPVGDPGRLHRRQHRGELRHRLADERAQQFLRQIEPVLPGISAKFERPRNGRLLDRISVDEGLLQLLEGRPVHEVRRAQSASARATATSRASTPRSTSRAT